MDDERGDGWGEIELLPEDPATPVHADIVPSGSAVGTQLADVLAAITHDMSEALTAVRLYSIASRHALRPAWPDRVRVDQRLSHATEQIARATDIVGLMRKLADQLGGSNRRDTIDRQLDLQSTPTRNDGKRHAQTSPPPAIGAAEKAWRDALDFHARDH